MDRNLIVRVIYSLDEKNGDVVSNKAHIINFNNEQTPRYSIGGGYFNKYGGSFTFKARNMEEAKYIANNNLFIKNKPFKYEMLIMDERTLIA